jgi:Aldo/keto reductase family
MTKGFVLHILRSRKMIGNWTLGIYNLSRNPLSSFPQSSNLLSLQRLTSKTITRTSANMGSTAAELPKGLAESVANSKAEYKRLGKSGLRVSVPILGAMSIGQREWLDWLIEEDEALPLLKAAYDRGLNTWDTANVYSNGASEQLIAKAIKKYNIPRQKVVILSKCYGTVGEEPSIFSIKYPDMIKNSKDYVNQSGSLPEVSIKH